MEYFLNELIKLPLQERLQIIESALCVINESDCSLSPKLLENQSIMNEVYKIPLPSTQKEENNTSLMPITLQLPIF